MICSEFVARMIKCAIVDVEVEKKMNENPGKDKDTIVKEVIRSLIKNDSFFQQREAGVMPCTLIEKLNPYMDS